jgi:very-short-patch-repair endonuclease
MNTTTRDRAKALRRSMTDAERRLWYHLRKRHLTGVKFKRQCPIGPYIVDFVALNAWLVVEVDGGQHVEDMAYDAERTRLLERQGFRVLRFWNDECLKQTQAVLDQIDQALRAADR